MGNLKQRRIWAAAAIAGLASMALAAGATAKTYTVNRTADHAPNGCTHSDCTLREAVLAADGSLGVSDVIVLPNSRHAYVLSIPNADPSGEDGSATGDLDITNDPLRIIHRGKGRATIDANGIDRVLQAYAPTVLSQIRVTGGSTPEGPDYLPGGGIQASANLKLLRSVVSGNAALGGPGGGIESSGSANVTLIRSTVRVNRTILNGGGVQGDSDGKVLIERGTIVGNRTKFGNGGGVGLRSGNLDIRDSTVASNRADRGGGGIAIYTPGLIGGIVNTTITGNRAGQDGGGVFVGDYGATLNGVTIARNVADSDGDANGAGGGLFVSFGGEARPSNTLIALNKVGGSEVSGGAGRDCSTFDTGRIESRGHNLIGRRSGCTGFHFAGSDLLRANPLIGGLKANGGPTKTIALLKGSPAIGRAGHTAPARDQRGHRRDAHPDIGAFER